MSVDFCNVGFVQLFRELVKEGDLTELDKGNLFGGFFRRGVTFFGEGLHSCVEVRGGNGFGTSLSRIVVK